MLTSKFRYCVAAAAALGLVALSSVPARSQQIPLPKPGDAWSPACTPDLVHLQATLLSVRCQDNGRSYHVEISAHPNGHVERMARMIQSVQTASKRVRFHDVGKKGSNVKDRWFDAIALVR